MSDLSFRDIVAYRKEMRKPKSIVVKRNLIGRDVVLAPILQSHFSKIRKKTPIKVLDVGAYDRALGRSLFECKLVSIYHSLDIDGAKEHDFHDINDIRETYDAICMFEFIEHLPFEEIHQLLHRAYELIEPGGCLFISTPNPSHPTRFFSDMTHKQHWPQADLYALLRHLGFERNEIEMYGVIYRDSFTLAKLPRYLVVRVRGFSWRLLGFDTQGGILSISTKSNSPCYGSL